jgi:ATP:ADP antiporter, AAA family
LNRSTLTSVAMGTAGIMLAHQVASKAFRDATFLSAWPATALPGMTLATAFLVLALVPLFSRLLARFSPLAIVTVGFAASAASHVIEWNSYGESRAIAVIIYLHLAGVSALLLSGFWSLIAERFDPATARAAYGRIAASGTLGGVLGSIAADRVAAAVSLDAVLLLLALLHVACVLGLMALRRAPALLRREAEPDERAVPVRELIRSPYVRTMASLVVFTSGGSAMLDYLLKSHATESVGAGAGLLRFFAVYYGSVQVLSFLAQAGSGNALTRMGIAGSIRTLPAGTWVVGTLALIFQSWPFIAALRATEAVLRGSLFRSAYELLFVPMDPNDRRRVKTFLDVTCDRAGESAGAGLIQLLLILPLISVTASVLTIVLIVEAAAFMLGRRLDRLYLGVVETQLLRHRDPPPVNLVSEIGWSILQLPATATPARGATPLPAAAASTTLSATRLDPRLELLAELRSNDAARVSAALSRTPVFDRIHVAQLIDLLAWDDVLTPAREALERSVAQASGMLTDALLEPSTDFAIRRRLPRVLATCPTPRALDGVVRGLDDSRFEVRYHCSRAINRMLAQAPQLRVDHARIIAVIERELSVPPQVWHGYRLLDRPDIEGTGGDEPPQAGEASRNLEHIFALLSTIVAREPLDAAVKGITSPNPGVRGLAIEYLDQVLPAAVLDRLRAMIKATPSASDAPAQSGSPPRATPGSTPR